MSEEAGKAPDQSAPAGRPAWRRFASLVLLLAIWVIAAELAGSDLLPGPLSVLERLLEEAKAGELAPHLWATLVRVGVSFTIAMTIGIAIGIVMGRRGGLDAFFDDWLVLGLNVPALVTTILCFLWLGLNEVGAIAAVVINKIPVVVVIMREGARALDRELLAVARFYRLPPLRALLWVVLPQLYPSIMASARAGLALIWKIVLVVELLGRSDGVGFQLSVFFQFFDITGILAYTLAFVAVIMVIEALALRPLERRLTRWRV